MTTFVPKISPSHSLSRSVSLSLSLSLSVSLCVSLSLTPFIFLLSSVSFVGFNLSLMLLYLSTAARSSIGALPPSLALCLFLSVLSRSRPLSLSLSLFRFSSVFLFEARWLLAAADHGLERPGLLALNFFSTLCNCLNACAFHRHSRDIQDAIQDSHGSPQIDTTPKPVSPKPLKVIVPLTP